GNHRQDRRRGADRSERRDGASEGAALNPFVGSRAKGRRASGFYSTPIGVRSSFDSGHGLPRRRHAPLYRVLFVKGVPQESYPISCSSVSLFDLGAVSSSRPPPPLRRPPLRFYLR